MDAESWSAMQRRGPAATLRDVAVHCRDDGGQSAGFADFPVKGVLSRSESWLMTSVFLSISLCTTFSVRCVKGHQISENQGWVAQAIAVVEVPEVCWASVFLQNMPWTIC